MAVTLDSVTPPPGMFFVPSEYEVVRCEMDGYEGLWAEILVSQRTFERHEFVQLRAAGGAANNVKAMEMAARWTRDWNVYEADADGNPVKVAPPMEGGVESFMRTNPKITTWILNEIQVAFLGGKGWSGSPKRSGTKPGPGTGQSADEPPATKASSSRRSRTNSSSPVA